MKMHLLKYKKLDLPVFEYDKVIWSKGELEDVCSNAGVSDRLCSDEIIVQEVFDARDQSSTNEILRYVKISYSADSLGLDLTGTLRRTSRIFEDIMKSAGGAVVSHEFGLVKLPKDFARKPKVGNEGMNSVVKMIPKGYDVVAKVEVLKSSSVVTPDDVNRVKLAYLGETSLSWVWKDYAQPSQYVRSFDENSNRERLYLVDIEPNFSLKWNFINKSNYSRDKQGSNWS